MNGTRFPHGGVIAVLSLLWLGLLGVTVWAWMLARGGAAAPGAGGAAVVLVWSDAAVRRFVERLEWAGLALGALLVAALVVGVAVQEKARRRNE